MAIAIADFVGLLLFFEPKLPLVSQSFVRRRCPDVLLEFAMSISFGQNRIGIGAFSPSFRHICHG